jgi:hypothetical protein
MTHKMKKKKQMKNFCDLKLQFTYVQATEEDFSPQKEHPVLKKFNLRIADTIQGPNISGPNPDPDPQHC